MRKVTDLVFIVNGKPGLPSLLSAGMLLKGRIECRRRSAAWRARTRGARPPNLDGWTEMPATPRKTSKSRARRKLKAQGLKSQAPGKPRDQTPEKPKEQAPKDQVSRRRKSQEPKAQASKESKSQEPKK